MIVLINSDYIIGEGVEMIFVKWGVLGVLKFVLNYMVLVIYVVEGVEFVVLVIFFVDKVVLF